MSASTAAARHGGSGADAHRPSPKPYFVVFGILIVLTIATVLTAFQDLGTLNTVVALTIAVTKAVLVILYFMHVRHSPRLTKLVIVSGFFWLLLLFGLTMGDYVTRAWFPKVSGWGG